MPGVSIEILCPACGAEALLRREPTYEGFKKTGERLFCAACRHEFASEQEVSFKQRKKPSVFSEAERPRKVNIFHSDEKDRNCRHCKHYVVNPFIQRCALHHREVQATDMCSAFSPKPAEDASGKNE